MSTQYKSSKRVLTSEEIEDIVMSLEPVKSIPHVVSESHINVARNRTREMLKSVYVYPEIIPQLKRKICNDYLSSRIQPGESVGIVTAQSIGERQTQMTLDTFHSAGAALKTVITGVPRFSELLSATPNPKTVACYIFPDQPANSVSELRSSIGVHLKYTLFSDIMESFEITTESPEPQWYFAYEQICGTNHRKYDCRVTITLKVKEMFLHKLSLRRISTIISDLYEDLECVYSPEFLGQLDVYFDNVNVEEYDVEKYVNTVIIPKLSELKVSGIENVRDVFYDKKDNEWIIETQGSNLVKILNMSGVSKIRTMSNDMWEIYNVLGIEAAREFLVEEFTATISSDGTYVNKCHVELLVDAMTFGGYIMSVSRYGQRKMKCSPLTKASFEQSLDNFLKAAVTGEKEMINSVSSSVMTGKLPTCGTGTFELFVNQKLLLQNIIETEYEEDVQYEI